MLFDDNNDNNSSNGNKGKFSERLKKMRRDRLKIRKKGTLQDDDEFALVTTMRNFFKIVLALPSVVYTHIIDNKKEDKETLIEEIMELENSLLNNSYDGDMINLNNRRIKVNSIRELDITSLKKKREYLLSKSNQKSVDNTNVLTVEYKKVKLQKEIIDLIKKKLIKNINDLEVLQSELYVLNKLDNGNIYFNECQQEIKEIKRLLSKIKSLKEKYDYLKDNVDFQYMLEYGDELLIDKILELKEICSRDDIRTTIDDYKILEEYKFLYLKIDKLQEEAIKLEDYKIMKAEELKERDIDFDKLKNDLYDVDMENERYDRFVREQELLLKSLEEKVSQIDSHEEVTYRLKGFNQLLGNSFKYLGLLLLNPLKGVIPGIVTQTLITRNVVHNLYNNLEWEESRRMVYDAIDYSTSIGVAINNLGDTAALVDSTLEQIVLLKKKYESEFSKYENSFSGYKDAIKKLNKIENAVLGSKVKIDSMIVKMNDKKRINDSKIKKVKKLNSSNNS